jgi:serine/threonine-protein kinase
VTAAKRDGGEATADDAPTKAEPHVSLPPREAGSSKVLTVDASGPSVALGAGSSSTISVTTAVETMRLQEIGRTRMFAKLALLLTAVVALSIIPIKGDPLAKIVLWIGIVPVMASMSWLWWLLRDEAAYRIGRVLVGGYACLIGAFCGIYFFGAFSPAPVVLPFGLYFFSSAQDLRATLSIYLTCAMGYAVLVIGILSGAFVDRGLVTASNVGTTEQALMLVLVEMILLVTFLSSRSTRSATLHAIERHDRVVRGLAQREALLIEARQELERALAFGGMGRFTDTTLGSFRLGKVIGRGAMGEVYEATQGEKGVAAVKLLHAHALADPDLLKRFLREAKIAASLDTPHVVRVLEIGGLDAPLPYIAMERLFGEDLADHFRSHKQLTVKKTITLVRQVGRGLEAARAAGIVHRDLKPRNIFLAEVGGAQQLWKILDFGISKLSDNEGTQQTRDMILGTPGYMAPEQAAGKEVTHRTDLFALGAIVYRALTGRPAFTGEHMAETIYQVAHAMPPRPSEIVKMHEDVDLVLAIAIAKVAGDRFDSAAELAVALDNASRGELEPALRSRAERLLEKHPWGCSGD